MAGEGQIAWDASCLAIQDIAGFAGNTANLANDGVNGLRKFFTSEPLPEAEEKAEKKIEADRRMIRRAIRKKRLEEDLKRNGFNSFEEARKFLGEE